MTTTTITFDSILWDRLNIQAQLRGQAAGSFVEDLLEAWLSEQRFAQIRRAMAETPSATLESYRAETRALGAPAGNGLDEQPAGR